MSCILVVVFPTIGCSGYLMVEAPALAFHVVLLTATRDAALQESGEAWDEIIVSSRDVEVLHRVDPDQGHDWQRLSRRKTTRFAHGMECSGIIDLHKDGGLCQPDTRELAS